MKAVMNAVMKAVSVDAPGGPDVLHLVDQDVPEPAAGEVTIDVSYAGVGLVDAIFRRGGLPIHMPLVPGIEVSGHVRALGAGVRHLHVGQPVAALLNDFVNLPGCGGYAEVARARAALTVPVPEGCTLVAAATVLVNGTAARMAVRDAGKIDAGDTVVVLGATGGLGGSIGQMVRKTPAGRVIGVIGNSSERRAAEALGYAEVVTGDEMKERLEAIGAIDVAFDTVGDEPRRLAFEQLAPLGRLVVVGNATGRDEEFSGDQIWLGSRTVTGLNIGGLAPIAPQRIASAASEVLAWAASGEIDATPARVLPLAEAVEAHRLLEAHRVAGKIVLQVGG